MINDPIAQNIQADLAQGHTAARNIHSLIGWLRTLRQPQKAEAEVLKLQICQLQQRLATLEAA